jgi:hypothetical protein
VGCCGKIRDAVADAGRSHCKKIKGKQQNRVLGGGCRKGGDISTNIPRGCGASPKVVGRLCRGLILVKDFAKN